MRISARWTHSPLTPVVVQHAGDSTWPGLSGSEALDGQAEGSLLREGAGQEEADASGIPDDDGTDLEQAAA